MNKTWLIADTHWGDSAILKFENRPFASVEEMDEALIRNWNEVVGKDDEVYVLGDVAWYDFRYAQEIIISKLKGHKILIMGNHDFISPNPQHAARMWLSAGFDEVSRFPIILDEFWILSHEPLYMNTLIHPYVNIFGHIHGNPAYKDFSPQSFCVSVERIGYKPIDFEEVKRRVIGSA